MVTLFKTTLAKDFLTLDRDAFIEAVYTGAHKSYFKANSTLEAYGKALLELGYGELFGDLTNPTDMVKQYLLTLVNFGYPVSEKEKEILDSIGQEVKEKLLYEIQVMSLPTMIAEHNLTEDSYLKVICAAKYIASSFCSFTTYYSQFIAGKISGEELTNQLREYITDTYDIILDDTNVAYNIPHNLGRKNRIKIYLPPTINLTKTDPINYMLNEVILELNDSHNYCLSTSLYNRIINVFVNHKTLYTFYSDKASVQVIFDLETYARKYMVRTVERLLYPTFSLGKPFTLNDSNVKVEVFGNNDNTLLLFVNNQTVMLDKESFGTFKRVLQNYKPCSMHKNLGMARDKDKVLLWDLIFSNAKPKDGNYNNITKKNVQ